MDSNTFIFDSRQLGRVQIDISKVPAGTIHFGGGEPPSGVVTAVTWFSKELVEKMTTSGKHLRGTPYLDAPLDEEHFTQNRQFIEMLHKLNTSLLDPDLLSFARSTTEPAVAIIDERSIDPNGAVPLEDIIGQYSIQNGQVVGYSPNPRYKLVTSMVYSS
ncbi:MAG: hypothetical protein IPO76_06450 [Elusimicrobia bacterium]|nr:hypothetical protein [Elusimicrobiota bacterium]